MREVRHLRCEAVPVVRQNEIRKYTVVLTRICGRGIQEAGAA